MNKTKLFSIAALCVMFTSCADMFQDRVSMQTGTNNATLSSLLVSEEEITKLASPAQVFASKNMYSDRILISWSAVENATSYRLERALATKADDGTYPVPDEGDFETLAHTTNLYSTNYEDVIIDQYSLNYKAEEYDNVYYYRVCAENARMKYDSSDFTVSGQATLLSPVKTISASMGESTDYVKVSWGKVNGASRYEIRRTEMEGGSTQHIDYVNGTQYWYKCSIPAAYQGEDFYFTVTAITSSGTSSVESAQAYGYTLEEGAPSRVSGVAITSGRGVNASGPISISWTSAGSDSKYVVYRSSSADSTLEKLKDGLTSTSYSDSKSLKENTYYYYYVQSVKGSGTDSDPYIKGPMSESGPDSSSPCEGFLLSPPQDIAVQKIVGSSQCLMSFAAALGSADCPEDSGKSSSYNTYTYYVYGDSSQNGSFNGVPFVFTPSSAINGYYSFQVDGYKFYKVCTVNNSVAAVSNLSSVVAPAPFAVKDSSSTCYAYISNYTDDDSQANENGVFPVKISWSAPDDGADGGYNVYRSTSKDTGFRKINDSAVTDTYYIDKNETGKAGTIYYYRVLSLNVLGNGVNYSPSTKGYGALTAYQYMREYCKTTWSSLKKLTLMHKSGNTAKLGTESKSGTISGDVYYNATIDGMAGAVTMKYTDYADFYINDKDKSLGCYFILNGNSNTKAGVDTNGSMNGTVTCTGMYPGSVGYDSVEIKGGAAGGGSYVINREGFPQASVDWTVGEK